MADDIIIPAILPPYEDGVFKAILTHPDAGPVLRDVLSSVLLLPVREATVRNAEPPIADISDKREAFDVNCLLDGGEQAEIEMQAAPMEGDSSDNRHEIIRSRAVYNLCDLHSSQPGRGTRYDKLMRSFQVTFCHYAVFAGREDFVNRFGFRNEVGEELSDAVGVVFVELTKLGKVMKKPVGGMTPLEMWAVFFAAAHKPGHRRLLDEMAKTKEEIRMATELLNGISSDEVQRAHFRSRRRYERDREHERAVMRDEIVERITKGVAEGVAESARNFARKAIEMNLPMEQIQALTGFTREEIESLARQ